MKSTSSKNEVDLNLSLSCSILAALKELGAGKFVVSPGTRSAALAVASVNVEGIEPVFHYDERGAAFYASGFTQSTQKPSVLVCTSGTAVANYLPAVMECFNSSLPLILLTADRPDELHNCGANQTIKQDNLFANFTVFNETIAPVKTPEDINLAINLVEKAFKKAIKHNKPVHINIQFRKPFFSTFKVNKDVAKFAPFSRQKKELSVNDREQLLSAFSMAKKGLVVVGSMPAYKNCEPLTTFLKKCSWPILADITSQLRPALQEKAFVSYTQFVKDPDFCEEHKPDCVIRIGGRFTSDHLDAYLAKCQGPYIRISEETDHIDPLRAISSQIHCDYDCLNSLTEDCFFNSKSELEQVFKEKEAELNHDYLPATGAININNQRLIVREAFNCTNDRRAFFLGNSLSIREADACHLNESQQFKVGFNRGVSGIDGLIASATGFAAGLNSALTLILGDLSALHDLNSLALLKNNTQPIIAIVINNDGGAIFKHVSDLKNLDKLVECFQTPHGFQFAGAAKQFCIDYFKIDNFQAFRTIYNSCIEEKSHAIIEVSVYR